MDAATFFVLAATCAPLVDPVTAHALVRVESGLNEHAIGVVSGRLQRQPRSAAEGLATARALEAGRWNFSVGLAQINVGNFSRLGLNTEQAFEPCANLAAMQSILVECFDRAEVGSTSRQHALRRALSCYYSGNFTTGFVHGYPARVVRAALTPATRPSPPRFNQETP